MNNTITFTLALASIGMGCTQIPMTTISVPTTHGIVTIKAPKDTDLSGLKANFETGAVSLDSYKSRMNPEVISSSAAGQVELIKAYGDLANNMAQLGLSAFAASHGVPLNITQPAPAPTQSRSITYDQLQSMVEQRAQALAAQRQTNNPAK